MKKKKSNGREKDEQEDVNHFVNENYPLDENGVTVFAYETIWKLAHDCQ